MDFIIRGDPHFHVAGADGGGPHYGQNYQEEEGGNRYQTILVAAGNKFTFHRDVLYKIQ
jgi:hypothetical protein